MGYTTDFRGSFQLNKPLEPKILSFLKLLSSTRRMQRNQPEAFGIEGEFFVFAGGTYGQDHTPDVVDYNNHPSTQPGLWCQWEPNEEGTEIEWDGGEKFYCYTEWLVYIIEKVLKPNGYELNGSVDWRGEDWDDNGTLRVEENVVYENNSKKVATANMRIDVPIIFVEDGKPLTENSLLGGEDEPTVDEDDKEIGIRISGRGTVSDVAEQLRQIAKDLEAGEHVEGLRLDDNIEWRYEPLKVLLNN